MKRLPVWVILLVVSIVAHAIISWRVGRDIEFTPLEETVKEAITYYQEHGTLGEYTHLRLEEKAE